MSRHHGLVRAFVRGCLLLLFFTSILLPAGMTVAGEKEPFAVIELGMASEWSLNGGGSNFGPAVAVEFTPIKNWLVIEPGVEKLFRHGHAEWDAGFVFKKPFDLTPSLEFEPGIGPVWMHTVGSGRTTIGAEIVAEFMFWPTPDRKFGWFLEPSYTYAFSNGHEQSFGVNIGLLIPINSGGKP
jgi:hypothetical protein